MMMLGSASKQKPGKKGRDIIGMGDTGANLGHDEAHPSCQQQERIGREGLLTQPLARENMIAAWKCVKANKGSAGVDGLTKSQNIKTHWLRILQEHLNRTYRQQAMRHVEIPKQKGGIRELGIPTVQDRLI